MVRKCRSFVNPAFFFKMKNSICSREMPAKCMILFLLIISHGCSGGEADRVLSKSWNVISRLEETGLYDGSIPTENIQWESFINSHGKRINSLPLAVPMNSSGSPSDMIVHFKPMERNGICEIEGSWICPVPTLLSVEIHEPRRRTKLAAITLQASPRRPNVFRINLAGHKDLQAGRIRALYFRWTPSGKYPARPTEVQLTHLRLVGAKRLDLIARPMITMINENLGRHLLYSRALVIPPGGHVDLYIKGDADSKLIFRGRSLGQKDAEVDFQTRAFLGCRSIVKFQLGGQWRQESIALSGLSRKKELLRIRNTSQEILGLSAVYFRFGGLPPPKSAALMIFDALRRDSLGVYGYPLKTSPNIDAFAAEHAVFSRALSAGPQTAWSVLHMLTSCWGPFELNEGQKFSGAYDLPPREIRRHGYMTIGVSQNINASSVHDLHQGYDLFFEQNYNLRALDVMDHKKSAFIAADLVGELMPVLANAGFFMYVHFLKPHSPYIPSDEGFNNFSFPYQGKINAKTQVKKPDVLFEWPTLLPDDRKQFRALYDACIHDCDRAFAGILDQFKLNRILERTFIVLASDHGELFGEHKGYECYDGSVQCYGVAHPRFLFQTTIAVPIIMALPGDRSMKVDELVSLIDVFPTILDFLKIRSKTPRQGKSLLPVMSGQSGSPRRLYASFRNSQHMAVAAFDGNRKAVRFYYLHDGRWSPDKGEVYDISDFFKDVDAVVSESDKEAMLGEIDDFLDKQLPFLDRLGRMKPGNLKAEQMEQLRSLGYL